MKRISLSRRIAAGSALALGLGFLPLLGSPELPVLQNIAGTTPAYAAGDVCDICGTGFDPVKCDAIGGWPYDSVQESPPPAVSGGTPTTPKPKPPTTKPKPNPTPSKPKPKPKPSTPAAKPASKPATPSSTGSNSTSKNSTDKQNADGSATDNKDAGSAVKASKDKKQKKADKKQKSSKKSEQLAAAAGEESATDNENAVEIEPSENETVSAAAKPVNESTTLAGLGTLGGLVLLGGGLLGWWGIRRRSHADSL